MKSLPNTIYISGPMTGLKDFNFPAFDEAKKHLEAQGWIVISPADMTRMAGLEGIGKTGNEQIEEDLMDALILSDIDAVKISEALYMLRGWEKSRGANAEHALGRWFGRKIIYQEDLCAIKTKQKTKKDSSQTKKAER